MKGITLIELLVSISIIAVIATIFISAFSTFRENSQLSEAQSAIIGLLKDARSRTLSSQNKSNYGIHFETAKAVLFKGDIYNSADASNEPYFLPTAVQIGAINLTNGVVDTVFTRLLGTTTASGTVTISSKRTGGSFRVITILGTGNAQ
ncbi:hypothetical protein A3B05_00185 [Candidatus Giovannonibacteria bacterium RIFCSPLOWO2_01_FULL_43_160]|uniref:Prepilin-type N-terminal cleavage/methylation domain-containing protein n=2 Tax=Candidatus Giovannoniibacteriota TaxID=1752738 RepID=A0A0G1IXN5_9BACT|nr:MAG: hypothetical protein UV72_C0001G0037 [Candidatus Giovannonibacteria bacterium GW2011_GWB1_43_13]KKS99760.1 MAG: hypothetical protein UV75_C0002G0141 [Candidatus Giovannonibacteria bacterium GW2011_GWA1_43_15]KKT20707.1 MAG: hypothetical protein UW05_C0032G0012 [Candidatus Giovannonibacteria bacterium GW2011_GWC2_43_8]KKT63845.1 MAG: hypothetical protein UW55_C0001G0138 [Candidatus Giovannonibacteria bacterium GW2011_GWA2_44_26]OGF58169.1 MAG: hypothetical protein A2652_02555 [Candidatus